MTSDYEKWKKVYKSYPLEALPWELGKPRQVLVELIDKGIIKKGKALDLCCGAGTNTIYLAKKGFVVTAMGISSHAVEYARERAEKAEVKIKFLVENFLHLSFKDGEFDLVSDIGCFHHVKVKDRDVFIKGVHRVLKTGGTYFLVCFSYRNGPAWNHFTMEQINQIFLEYFEIKDIRHVSSIEGDGITRYFYSVLMEKR